MVKSSPLPEEFQPPDELADFFENCQVSKLASKDPERDGEYVETFSKRSRDESLSATARFIGDNPRVTPVNYFCQKFPGNVIILSYNLTPLSEPEGEQDIPKEEEHVEEHQPEQG